jgi:sec-independent protein translocase protein TatB
MFDIGFSELIVIGVIALIVVGPERLPKVARTAGLLLGRLQRYVSDFKADIGREIQLEELKKLQAEVRESARDFERSLVDEVRAIEQGVEQTVDSVKADLQIAASSSSVAVAEDEPAVLPRHDDSVSLPAVKGQ